MLYATALEIINKKDKGFMVHFERVEGSMLCSDYFPEKLAGEKLIPTEEEAWDLAKKLAAKTKGEFVNFYVIDSDFRPIPEYKRYEIKNR